MPSTARRTQLIDGASDAVDAATQCIELTIGLEPLAGGQSFAKDPNLLVFFAFIEATSCDRLVAQFLKEGGHGFDPNPPPISGQSGPPGHSQTVTSGSLGQNFNETSCQLFIAHAHNFHHLVAHCRACPSLVELFERIPVNVQIPLLCQIVESNDLRAGAHDRAIWGSRLGRARIRQQEDGIRAIGEPFAGRTESEQGATSQPAGVCVEAWRALLAAPADTRNSQSVCCPNQGTTLWQQQSSSPLIPISSNHRRCGPSVSTANFVIAHRIPREQPSTAERRNISSAKTSPRFQSPDSSARARAPKSCPNTPDAVSKLRPKVCGIRPNGLRSRIETESAPRHSTPRWGCCYSG